MSAPHPIRTATNSRPESPTLQINTTALRTTAMPSHRFVSLDVLRGLAILLMIFSGMIPKTLPNWMDHGYQPHWTFQLDDGLWHNSLTPEGDAQYNGRWKAMTWVDLVFPMFLFSMGAAIPVAMSRRLERGESKWSLARTIVSRFLMLMFFSVLLRAINPPALDGQSEDARKLFILAISGVAFLFFVRWPATVSSGSQRTIRWIAGFVLIGIMVANAVQRADLVSTHGRGEALLFSWEYDAIIAVLAYTYLVSGIAWLILPRWGWARFAILVPLMLLAHYLGIDPRPKSDGGFGDWLWMGDWPWKSTLFHLHGNAWTLKDVLQSPLYALNIPGWIAPLRHAGETRHWLLHATDLSPLYNFTWLKYLWIVVPGTIVGDWLMQRARTVPAQLWIDPMTGEVEGEERPLPRWPLLVLAIAAIVLTCIGVRNYDQPTLGIGGAMKTPYFALTFALPVILLTAIAALVLVPREHWLVRRLAWVGAIFTTTGLVLACVPWPLPHVGALSHSRVPDNGIFEGGISKGPPSPLSYYFTTVGLCMQLLAGLFALFDANPRSARRVGLIEANGQNPLLVYYLEHLVVGAIFGLAIFSPFHSGTSDSCWSHVTSLDDLGRWPDHPWYGAGWGAMKTLLIAAFVWVLTRRKIFWRA